MTETAQVGMTATTLAQKTAAKLREDVARLEIMIEAKDTRISELSGAVAMNWRNVMDNPGQAEQLAEDLRKENSLREVLRQSLAHAQADLQAAERQIVLDRFAEVRAQFDSVMQQRTKRAHDIVATVESLAAMIEEVYTLGQQGMRLFSGNAADAGITFTTALQSINKVQPQEFVNEILASKIGNSNLWDTSDGRNRGKHYRSPYAERIDAERTALLVELGSAARRTATIDDAEAAP